MNGAHSYNVINTCDIETFEEKSKIVPYCVCFILNNKNYVVYYDKNENIILKFINLIYLLSKDDFIEIYVHNINFDGLLIINEISQNGIKYNLMTNKTNLYYLEIFYFQKCIKFRCSFKLLPMSLKHIGDLENFPKTPFPHKFVKRFNLFYVGKIPSKNY
jgi:hypothetical protein